MLEFEDTEFPVASNYETVPVFKSYYNQVCFEAMELNTACHTNAMIQSKS